MFRIFLLRDCGVLIFDDLRAMRVLGVVAWIAAGGAFAADAVRTGPAAYGDWRADAPGVRRLITAADLPPPFATLSAGNPSRRAARKPSDVPKAPDGFSVDLFAKGLSVPRVIRTAPNGDIFVAESGAGRVRVFRPDERAATPAQGAVFADGLDRPFGIAFYPVRRPALGLCRDARLGRALSLSQRRPQGLGPGRDHRRIAERRSHWTRDLAVSPDDKTLFVSVGSATNVDEGVRPRASLAAAGSAPRGARSEDRADVLAFDPDGSHGASSRPASATARPRGAARDRRALVRDQRARRARRRSAARLRDARRRGRVLWLALVLYRRQRGPAP